MSRPLMHKVTVHDRPQNSQLMHHLVQGIRWQIQMERLRLQQWKTLNARVEVAMESQRQQVAMRLVSGS